MLKKTIRVAMLGQKVVPSRSGGIEKVLTDLCPRLVDMGIQVTAFNRSHEKSAVNDYNFQGSEFKGVHLRHVFTIHGRGLSALSSSLFGTIRILFSRFDIIHFHAEGPAAMIWLPHLFNKKCVVTVHGLDWKREKWNSGLSARYIKFGERMLAKYADTIIVLNNETKKYFEDVYHRDTVYIPNGIEIRKREDPSIISTKYDLGSQNYILSVSRLTPEKEIHTLIKAFRKLRTDMRLIIAGTSSDSDDYVTYLKQLAAGDPRIQFVGFVTGKELAELYSNAYVYALVSSIEGMPLTLLEAMAYGNAVIGSDIPEISEVVGDDHALLVKVGDVNGLYTALDRLIHHSDIQSAMRASSARYICMKYNWDDIAVQTTNEYKKLCETEGK